MTALRRRLEELELVLSRGGIAGVDAAELRRLRRLARWQRVDERRRP